ncbi:IQ domain-containing protein C [Crocuta crocuta]
MERERLVRGALVLQACVRGFLVRRHIQRLREEYEAVVREIEGDLGTLQWTEGWIPRPQFLPEKAKSHRTCKPQGRAPNPEQHRRGCFSRNEPEREAVLGEKMLKQSRESSASSGSLPCRGNSSPWPRDEHSRSARNPSQEETRDTPRMENPEAVGPGLPHSQPELQELQHHHSHLAMELLWLQQAINSRKEYLILKQTLASPEASQTRDKASLCPDLRAQTCERPGSQTSPPLKDKSYRDRTTEGPDHVGNSCWRLKSQPHKCLESLAAPDKTAAGVKCRDPCSRRAGAQLPTPSDNQVSENRLAGEPHRGEQPSGGPSLPLTRVPEDQIPKGLEPRGCSAKARMRVATLCDDPDVEDKCPRKPECKEPECQRAGPQELDLSEDCGGIWDETLAEPGGQDLWKTKPPKGQIPSEKSSRGRTSSEPSHEQWNNQRAVSWRSRPPKKLSLTESAHTEEDHRKDKSWKTGPPG